MLKDLRGEYLKSLLKRFPDTPDLTLAKKAYKEEPALFLNLEGARAAIRYLRGHIGKNKLEKLKDKTFLKDKTHNTNPFNIPESHKGAKAVWKLPKSIKKVLVLSDLHFPYQDVGAINTALSYGEKEGIDCIFINGDMLDFYQVSFHERDPRKMNIKGELEMGREFFKSLKDYFPKIKKYYIPGNHEYRLERYLKVKAPELLDCEEFRLDSLLRVREYDIDYVEYGTKCYFGKLLVEHGDKMKGSGGVNPARTLFLKLKRHAICGHFHRTTENTAKIYDGDVIVTYSTGCLCELEPSYLEVNEHNLGFCIVEMDGDNFTVLNKKIVNNKVY